MSESILLYFRIDHFQICTRVLEVPAKQRSGPHDLNSIAGPSRLAQEADRVELYRDGKFVRRLKDRNGIS